MNKMKIAVAGASGRMGRILIDTIVHGVEADLVGALDAEQAPSLGTDATAFLGEEPGGRRSDTIMVARVDAQNRTVDLVSFPRDLWVPIAGTGSSERINTAYGASDGPQRLIDTIRQDFDIEINRRGSHHPPRSVLDRQAHDRGSQVAQTIEHAEELGLVVHEHLDVRMTANDCAGRTGMIQVNVRQQQMCDVLKAHAT